MNRRFLAGFLVLIAAILVILLVEMRSDIPPINQLNEIEVNCFEGNRPYFIRIFPNGFATVAFGSQSVGDCPSDTFNFRDLYDELSALPKSRHPLSGLGWTAWFPRKHVHVESPTERQIEDPEIVSEILKKIVNNSPPARKQVLLKHFVNDRVLPPAETAELKGLIITP